MYIFNIDGVRFFLDGVDYLIVITTLNFIPIVYIEIINPLKMFNISRVE